MRYLALAACLVALAGRPVRAQGELTNGGFETLGADYFPVDWSPVGAGVAVTTDARSGRHALRIQRALAKPMPPETGLNRAWTPNAGRGAMLERTRGVVRGWFRLRSAAHDASVALVVIPMGEPGIENTGEMRATRPLPNEIAGATEWREVKLAYDYTRNPKVRWIHVGVRMTGGPADLLLDDLALIEGETPILQIEKAHMVPDPAMPDRAARLSAMVTNSGTAPSGRVDLTLHMPPGVTAEGPISADPLAPGAARLVQWRLRGAMRQAAISIVADEASGREERTLHLVPRLELVSALASPSLVAPGASATVRVTVWNRGTAVAEGLALKVECGGGARALAPPPIPALLPGRKVSVGFVVRAPAVPGSVATVACRVPGADPSAGSAVARLQVTHAVGARPDAIVPGVIVRRGSDRTVADIEGASRSRGALAGRMPHLGRVTFALPNGKAQTLTARYGPAQPSPGGALLRAAHRDRAGGTWSFEARLSALGRGATRIAIAVTCTAPRRVLLFEGPCILAGEGGAGAARREAIFPGLEWLVEDEVSSGDLDIVPSHPDRLRYAPHPNKVTIPAMAVSGPGGTVAMLWDARARWDARADRPQPVFASPDRIEGAAAHRLSLIAPNAVVTGGDQAPHTAAQAARVGRGIALAAGRPLSLSSVLWVGEPRGGALRGIEEWFARYRPEPPAPAPRGNDAAQVSWSMQAYLKTMWDGAATGWWPYLNGPALWRNAALNASYAFDLLEALRAAPRDPAAPQWAARLRETGFMARAGREGEASAEPARIATADDAHFVEGDPIAGLRVLGGTATAVQSQQKPDGSFTFDANRRDTGVFAGYDFNELGGDGATEIGLMARNAYDVLRAARLSGDRSLYEAGVRTLRRIEAYTVPRAAQVWEVPLHTPDILAAADAVEAYLEAYWYGGDARWLDRARIWARRGLPFIYVWNDPDKLWMRYGSIPVFGASQMRYSWFGNVVQWNGLRYALALLKLYPHDRDVRWGGLSWRDLAIGITRSAMYQQSSKPAILATWPDSLHTITMVRAAWDFAPRQILKNVNWWRGRPEEPSTVRIPGRGGPDIRVSSSGSLSGVGYRAGTVRLDVTHPPRGRGSVLIAGITKPRAVTVAGVSVPEARTALVAGRVAWRYDPSIRAVAAHIPGDGRVSVRVVGVQAVATRLAAPRADRIAFEFDTDDGGWSPLNDVADLQASGGTLRGRSSGGDPYLARPNMLVEGDRVAEVSIRIRADRGGAGQLYWTTESSPSFDEQKVLTFAYVPDGAWHEVRIAVGAHHAWRGQRITALRVDPANVASAVFALDWVRGLGSEGTR